MPVYLDNAATAPIRPSVIDAYTRALKVLGNPASVHSFGQKAREILEQARESIAQDLGCHRSEVIFTSGGTESDNLGVKGIYWHRRASNPRRQVIITSAAEHHAVLDSVEWLVREQGAEAIYLPMDSQGILDLATLEDVLVKRSEEVALITLMWANNEIGVVNPISMVSALAKPHDIPVHSDAIAALGHIPVDFQASGLAAMTITGHKLGSQVGVGALMVSRSQKITPVLHGGGQERGMRSGSPDAAAAAAFAQAVSEAVREQGALSISHQQMRQRLIAGVREITSDVIVSCEEAPRLPNNVHFRFPGCLGDSLLFLLDISGVSVSTGSACTAGVAGPSHVVLALGANQDEAMGTLRITFGHQTTMEDIDAFLAAFPDAYAGAKKAGLTRK